MKKVLGRILGVTIILGLLVSVISCSRSSTETPTTATTQKDYMSPYITGEDWNEMTVSQKRDWVEIALEAMILGGELEESKRYSTDYYVQALDEVFSDPSSANKLVAWELTAFTRVEETPISYPDWWSKEGFSNKNPKTLPTSGTMEMLPKSTLQIPFHFQSGQGLTITTTANVEDINYIEPMSYEYSSIGLLMNCGLNPQIPYTGEELCVALVKVTNDGKGIFNSMWDVYISRSIRFAGFAGRSEPQCCLRIILVTHETGIYSLCITNKTDFSSYCEYTITQR